MALALRSRSDVSSPIRTRPVTPDGIRVFLKIIGLNKKLKVYDVLNLRASYVYHHDLSLIRAQNIIKIQPRYALFAQSHIFVFLTSVDR